MNTFTPRTFRTGVLAGTSVLTAAALLATASPALADPTGTEVARAASLVERATGTQDLAPSTAATGSAARAVTATDAGSVTVTAPGDSRGYVEATTGTGARFRIHLPQTKKVDGVRTGAGTIVYQDAAKSADLAVQPTDDGGARALVTLKDSTASDEYRFDLDLPSGSSLTPDGDGGYLITRSGDRGTTVLGSVDAPWAKDADGRPVPTTYRLEGGTLVQTVKTSADTAFPVVADPKVSFGWNIYIKFTKGEVKALNNKVQYADTSTAACALLVNPVAAVGCAGLSLTVIKKIQRVWQYAKDHKRCVELSLTYAGLFADVKHYKC
ncbi:hypothetical protein F8R89_21630 [Streptomyces sp. SS1-1]|uniref:hypothetical protein n=1 Tax=Streptomyces sp. SS1-1 TaxID=2651869 RepID=UPI00124FBC1E|nr:hypothetical protein [Streptomyces sp. SS1-1]KAB2974358.1 hypothetical protein F8R89_21630 [Streptomyces sp. SS1-1]